MLLRYLALCGLNGEGRSIRSHRVTSEEACTICTLIGGRASGRHSDWFRLAAVFSRPNLGYTDDYYPYSCSVTTSGSGLTAEQFREKKRTKTLEPTGSYRDSIWLLIFVDCRHASRMERVTRLQASTSSTAFWENGTLYYLARSFINEWRCTLLEGAGSYPSWRSKFTTKNAPQCYRESTKSRKSR